MTATRRHPAASTPADRVALAYERIEAAQRPEIWIHLLDRSAAEAQAADVQARLDAGAALPLAGVTLAVKDNIDVAGLPTTAACPEFAYTPTRDAPAVARLRAAGAIVLGKTNLDQFATGLVGIRSPYGAVRDARDPDRIAGGSSAGSAVAVALGLSDLALGTDTAGSGRIPAAFAGIVGAKPTRGLVSTRGVVPACRSFDCVSVFARSVDAAEVALDLLAGAEDRAADAPLAAPPAPRIAVFGAAGLEELSPAYRDAFTAVLGRLGAADGVELVEIDHAPFLSAGALLYGGAFVAERYAAVGAFIESGAGALDPSVASIIIGAREITAAQYLADAERLEQLAAAAAEQLRDCHALLLPTAPGQPTIAEVQAAPLERNRWLGTYVSFCNLLDMCGLSLPAGEAGGGQFGVTLYGRRGHDAAIADLGRRLAPVLAPEPPGPLVDGDGLTPPASLVHGNAPEAAAPYRPAAAIELLVLGAHLRGQPLNPQLTERGARFLASARTAPGYRLYRLDTEPPKPGLVRAGADADGSAASGAGNGAAEGIAGELWALPPAGLASLLAALPAPMALGPVTLADGRSVVGFLCEPAALHGAREITHFGGWREYLGALVQ